MLLNPAALVNMLLDVSLVRWTQRSLACQAMGFIQCRTLFRHCDWRRSITTTFCSRSLENDVATSIRVTGLGLDRFLPTQSENGL